MLPRIFIRVNGERQIRLSKEESHHLTKVLRLDLGAELRVVDPITQASYQAIIAEKREVITIKITAAVDEKVRRSPVVTLAMALTKGDHNDLVCEKATELGIENLIFWQAERSVAKFDNAEHRLERLRRIALAACKQSGKSFLPGIEIVRDLKNLIEKLQELKQADDSLLICSLAGEAKLAKDLQLNSRAHVVVGPEGDFTLQEEQQLASNGFSLLSLGPYTLRSETAAIAAISGLQAVMGFK